MDPFTMTFTEKAKSHYLKLLEKNPTALGIRFFTKRAGCSGLMYQSEFILDENSGDLAVFEEGKLKIFVSQKSMPYLKGIRVDVVKEALGQSKVVYENPNEVGRCGCGESFKVKD